MPPSFPLSFSLILRSKTLKKSNKNQWHNREFDTDPPIRAGMATVQPAVPLPALSASSSLQQHQQQPQTSGNDRTAGELRALDCNLGSLCDHIQIEGFNNGAFSDVVVEAMGSTYHLHRLILSRSSYFRSD